MTKGKLIEFEGDNLAGKTTLAKRLEEALKEKGNDALYLKAAPSESFFGKLAEETGISSIYFLDYLLQEQNCISPLLANGINVILDRGFYSIASFSAAKHDIDVARLSCFPHLLPYILVYVIADREERMRRAENRELSAMDAYLFQNSDFEKRIRENYEKLFEVDKIPLAKIDTTEKSPSESFGALQNDCNNLLTIL